MAKGAKEGGRERYGAACGREMAGGMVGGVEAGRGVEGGTATDGTD